MKPIWFPLAGFIWISVVAFTIYHNWGWWRGNDFWENLLLPLFLGVLVFAVFGAGLLAGAYGISRATGDHADVVWRQYWHGTLASMRNSDGVSGSISGGIFMISGNIGSREIYYYYIIDSPNHYKPHKWMPDEDTTVIEEDRTDAEVFQFDSIFSDSWMYWFAIPNDRLRMDFHIPKGSLVHQYSIK